MSGVLFDYSKLKGRITEKCGTQKNFAGLMGISEATLTQKLAGRTSFSQRDIFKATNVLDIEPHNISIYFFTVKVQ